MKKLLLPFLLITFFFTNAQITFEKGYFISNSGEREECFIKNIDWNENPIEFKYKVIETDLQYQKQSLLTVQEFGIDGSSKYKRFKINVERSGNDLKELSRSKSPIWKEEILFLKVLIEGDATLYSYTNEGVYKYFYETKTKPIQQLVHIKYISNNDNKKGSDSFEYSVMENNLFRQQLYNDLICKTITDTDFKNLKYDKTSLVKIFNKYNSCIGTKVKDFDVNTNKNKLGIKINLGFDQTSLSITDPNYYYNLSTDIKGQIVFKIGAEIEYILPFNKDTWSVFVNLMYQRYTAEKTYVKNDGFGVLSSDITNHVKANYSGIDFPFGLRHYFFLNSNSKIFLNAGYSFNLATKSKFTFENEKNNKELESSSRNNFLIGLGYTFKNRYFAEVRLNSGRQLLSDYITWSGKYSSIGIILSYKIF